MTELEKKISKKLGSASEEEPPKPKAVPDEPEKAEKPEAKRKPQKKAA
jgi:hypothetical protein